MNHTKLYNSLITRGITTWDDTIVAVIELEDNLEIKETASTSNEAVSTKTSQASTLSIEQIVAFYWQVFRLTIGTLPLQPGEPKLKPDLICHRKLKDKDKVSHSPLLLIGLGILRGGGVVGKPVGARSPLLLLRDASQSPSSSHSLSHTHSHSGKQKLTQGST